MNLSDQTLVALNAALCLQLVGSVIVLAIDPYISKRNKRIMLLNSILAFTLVVQQQLGAFFEENPHFITARTITSVYGYCVRPLILYLFLQVSDKLKKPIVLVIVNTAVYMTAFFSDIAFGYSSRYEFIRGPLGYTCHIIGIAMLFLLALQTILHFRWSPNRYSFFPILIVASILISTFADTYLMKDYSIDLLTVSIVGSCVFYYIWLHLQFVAEHERDLKAEQRIKIMMSQIRPHFLFNTLMTIQSLCKTDPELAADTIQKFGVYLRQNIDTLNHDILIPFDKELEYTKAYSEIEAIRFPDIMIRFDIQDNDFELPALTVQPFVENAVRHGVRGREDGTVSVTTRYAETYHEIIIRDNGKGFDVEEALRADYTHIGIRNVKERIEEICNGTVTICSTIGEGTEITIHIPV